MGTSGFDEFWMGSNAYKLVAHAQCPVITLRSFESSNKKISKILLPIDSTRQTRQKIFLCELLGSNYFDAELVILSIYSSKVDTIRTLVDDYSAQAAKYCEKYNVKFSQDELDVVNITDSTVQYAMDNNIDIISIMTDQESAPINLLLGPYAQQMVNHSPIPVLTIRSKNIYDYKLN